MDNTITTRKMQANEGGRGNLAGTEIRCTCGFAMGTTMNCDVNLIAHEHASWHARTDVQRAKDAAKYAANAKRSATRKRNLDPFGYKSAGLL